jgi:hypothetical protein|tara:strand:- start:299 stop:472 length:174 start_codon:yes stop_codon:yes gene_type:complete
MSTEFMPDFSKQDYKLIIDALKKRQTSYIAGDRMYKEYGKLINEMDRRQESAVPWRV